MSISNPGGSTDNDALHELRDDLKDLTKTIKEANIVNGRLTVLIFLVAYCQLFITIYQLAVMIGGTGNRVAWIAAGITVVIGGFVYYFISDYMRTEKENHKKLK